jgi:hypothetical protein
VLLTGAGLRGPYTIDFRFVPGGLWGQDRWRLTDGHAVLVDDAAEELPEVTCLGSVERTTEWLELPRPVERRWHSDVFGRATVTVAVREPRRCDLVVDQETGFVLSAWADGPPGRLSLLVSAFDVRPDPSGPGRRATNGQASMR